MTLTDEQKRALIEALENGGEYHQDSPDVPRGLVRFPEPFLAGDSAQTGL